MQESPQPRDIRELVGRARQTLPRRRFWCVLAIGIALGLLLAIPLVLLLEYHDGPWTGFLWDLLTRLPFALLCLAFVVRILKSIRAGKWTEAAKGFLVLGFFGLLSLLPMLTFAWQARALVHFQRLRWRPVRAVRVACHVTDDPVLIQQIVTDLSGAQWFSPMSHGWSPYADLTLTFTDGRTESYALTQILGEGRLVVRPPEWGAGLLAVPHLSISMERARLLKVAAYPRYDNKGMYQAIVPTSVCQPGKMKDP